jgi:hypothetical protein
MWGKHYMGKKVVAYCDNEASVTVLNTGFSRDMFMQSCLREICYLAAVHGFEGRSRHIVGFENRAADYLSRWHSNYKNTVNFKSSFHQLLELNNAYDATIWCLFLTAFFLMIRKANLVPNSAKTFQSQKQLIRENIEFDSKNNVLICHINCSKTIQYGEGK